MFFNSDNQSKKAYYLLPASILWNTFPANCIKTLLRNKHFVLTRVTKKDQALFKPVPGCIIGNMEKVIRTSIAFARSGTHKTIGLC